MKKTIKILATFAISIVMALTSFGIVGCKNSDENSVDYSDKIAELEQQIKDLQDNQVTDNSDEIADLQQKIDSLDAKSKTDSETIAELEQQISKLDVQGKTDSATIAKLEQQIKDLQFNLLNSKYKFFSSQRNKFEYTDFDYSMIDDDYSHEFGSEENELVFSKIISGEYDYRDWFDWFLAYPDYIYRFTEESLKCIEAVIREGKFTEELRAKYSGFYVDGTPRYLADGGMSCVSYQIYFNDDWTIFYIRQTRSEEIFNSEFKQITKHYNPNYNEEGNLDGYYLSFINSSIKVDMGDGKFADCTVDASYFQTPHTQSVWNGEKQEHEYITFLSECSVTVDSNNNYSSGYEMFDSILIFAQAEGLWDMQNVWAAFREEALVPSSGLYPGMSKQKIRLFNPLY